MTPGNRLEPLERKNRWRRWMGLVGLGVIATSVIVWAISFPTRRVGENGIGQLYNHALIHAAITWNAFDPDSMEEGQHPVPKEIVADLADPDSVRRSEDPMIAEAAEKFPGCKFIRFEKNDLSVNGSSVVASIEINGPGGSTLTTKQFLSRAGVPITERFRSPSIER